jgi:hypothetical protein
MTVLVFRIKFMKQKQETGNERPGSMHKVLKKQTRRLQEDSEPYIVT